MPDDTVPAEQPAAATIAVAPPIFRNHQFLALWAAQATSQVAQNGINLALLVLVQERTHSPAAVSLTVLSFIVPSVLFGILAGVFVDRMDKKVILVITNALRAIAVLGYIFFDQTLGLILMVSFVFATISQFFSPAEAASIPRLVRRDDLITANSLFNLTFNGSQLIGFLVLTPLIIKFFGLHVFFLLCAGLYVLAAVLVSLLPRERARLAMVSSAESQRLILGIWAEIKEGWAILTHDQTSSLAMAQWTLVTTMVPLLAVVGPAFAESVIRARPEDVVFLFAPAGIGMILTTALLNRLAHRFAKQTLITAGMIILGCSLLLVAAAKTGGSYLLYNLLGRVIDTSGLVMELIPIIMVLAFFLGIAFALINIPSTTIIQERCPASFRGRIFAVQFTVANAASIVPLLFIGGIAALIGVNKTIFLTGLLILASAAASWRVRHEE
jgi:MFS family permease